MRLPLLAAAISGVLVGVALVATRSVIAESSPAALALLRYAIGACILLPFVVQRTWVPLRRRDMAPIAILGILQFGVLIALMNFGVQRIPAARAALIFSLMPLLTMLLAAALRLEMLTTRKVVGVLLTIAGVGVALGQAAGTGSVSGGVWIGDAAILLSALCGAVCSVLYRRYVQRYPPLQVGTLAMVAAVGFLLIPAGFEGFFAEAPRFSGGGLIAVGVIGLASGIGYYLWLWALSRASPTQVTVFLGLSPLTALVLGAVLLGEPLTLRAAVALVLVVVGLIVALGKRDAASPGDDGSGAEQSQSSI